MKKLLITFLFVALYLVNVKAQSWLTVGTANISGGSADNTSILIDNNNVPYVVFADAVSPYKASVRKFDGTSWTYVGSAGFTSGGAYSPSIAFDGNWNLYIVYQDMDAGNKISVMKFDGTSWGYVGSQGFTQASAGFFKSDIAIDYNNVPYIIFGDSINAVSNRASVLKYDGANWVYVGSPGFSPDYANNNSIAIDGNGTPYVAFTDAGNSSKATVFKFDGAAWTNLSPAGISTGACNNITLEIDNSNYPYLAYRDDLNGAKAAIRKFDGTAWQNVGGANATTGPANYLNLTLYHDSIPYIAFQDAANGNKPSAKLFNGTSWALIGTAGFASSLTFYHSIAVDGNGVPYVAFKDAGNSSGITVKKFDSPTGINNEFGSEENTMEVYPNPGKDYITIKLNKEIINTHLEISNILEEKIYCAQLNKKEELINTQQFAPGIYFVKINDGEKENIQKLIIQ